MKKQIICFIDPSKFYYFLDEKFPLNDHCLGYVNSAAKAEFDQFIPNKAQEAAILIVPDSFELEKEYIPEGKFKILYHGGTDKECRIDPFIKLTDKCEGEERSIEQEFTDDDTKQKTTPYNDIKLFLSNNEITFDYIYNKLKSFDKNLESILNFLHGCLLKCPQDSDYSVLKEKGIIISDEMKLNGNPGDSEYTNNLDRLRHTLLKHSRH